MRVARITILAISLTWTFTLSPLRGQDVTSWPPNISVLPSDEPTISADSPWHWHTRPAGFVYGTYWASAAEPRLATHVVDEPDLGTLLDSHIGGRLGLVRFGPRDRPEGFQLDLLAGAKLRQDTPDLDFVATDFRYDILGTYGWGQNRFKFGMYHVSSHLGDEFLLRTPGFERLNFFRDTVVAGYSFYAQPSLRLYAEAGYAFHLEVSEPWEFQFGFDYGPAHPTGTAGAPFIALNTHLREELDFGGNIVLQGGWAWRGANQNSGTLRTGVYYYKGKSPQNSFFRQSEQHLGWGLWYDF